MTNICNAEMWLCDIGLSIVCRIGGGSSGSGQQQQQQTAQTQNLAANQTGQFASGATNAGQLQDALNSGQSLYENGNPLVNSGLANVNAGAQEGQDLNTTGTGALKSTLDGSMLDSGNPYFTNMVTNLSRSITPQIAGQFEGAGRYGSGAAANATASALTNEAGTLAYNNYNDERNRQVGAATALPSFTAGLSNPGQQQVTAGYAPLNQYITQLGQLKPGTLGSGSSVSNQNSSSTGSTSSVGQGDSSNFGVSAKAQK